MSEGKQKRSWVWSCIIWDQEYRGGRGNVLREGADTGGSRVAQHTEGMQKMGRQVCMWKITGIWGSSKTKTHSFSYRFGLKLGLYVKWG